MGAPQTRQRLYEKDLDFSYKPFLSILGTGLVTADGPHWQKQRLLMAPALRVDMLDAIIPIAVAAVERLCAQLEAHRGSGVAGETARRRRVVCSERGAAAWWIVAPLYAPAVAHSSPRWSMPPTHPCAAGARAPAATVDLEEEFRLLTLQIIGEAILSLPPGECDRVFPQLYLPVMEESNRRVLAPWRQLYPLAAYRYSSRVSQLNGFIMGIIRARRASRAAACGKPPAKPDILDRVLAAAEVGWLAALLAAPAAPACRPFPAAVLRPLAAPASSAVCVHVAVGVQESGEKWTVASEVQLCYEIKTFLLAGHETSSAMLCWTMYELSRNKAALEKVGGTSGAVPRGGRSVRAVAAAVAVQLMHPCSARPPPP